MAKKKKIETLAPIKHKGVLLPLSYPEIPENWMPADDYSSHRPMLYRAIMNYNPQWFFELGMGQGSTPLLKEYYLNHPEKDYVSFENDEQWYELLTSNYSEGITGENWIGKTFENHAANFSSNLLQFTTFGNAIVFIDSAPGEQRKELISKNSALSNIIIVHDTEPGAEYVYNMAPALNEFKFRCDLICEGMPQTTAVSNIYDFANWKTVVNDKIRFV